MAGKVVLINTACGIYPETDIGPGNQHLGLLTIQEGLRFAGFDDVSLFPHVQTGDSLAPRTIIDGLEEIVGNRDVIIGITAMTEVYYNLVELSRRIREKFPRAVIIGGGPHFRREPWNKYGDPIKAALEERLVDAVVQGHAQPFIDLVVKHGGDLETAKNIPGLYMLDSLGKVIGQGAGKYPEIGQVPIIAYKIKLLSGGQGNVIHILLDDSCRNFCDFCCVDKSSNGVTRELAKAALEKAFSGIESAYLVLEDSNPFEPEKISFYEEVFGHLDSKNSRIMKTGFVDPSLFTDETYFPKLLEFFFRHNFRKFFIGRDCVTEKDANMIGTRYRGKLRPQKQLDHEKAGIERFIHQLENHNLQRESDGLPPCHYQIKISYIVSPYSSEDAHLQMFDEMDQFESMSKPNLQIFPRYFILAPFPGTRLKRKQLDEIADPKSFGDHHLNSNAWKRDSPGSLLLDTLIALERSRFRAPWPKTFYDSLRQAVTSAYHSGN